MIGFYRVIAPKKKSLWLFDYAFNGKENDKDFGNDQLVQDYGFRIYNPSIARFLSVDPLAPDYPELTTYQFASNSPIAAIDLDGLEAIFGSQREAELVVNDLNLIYSKTYPKSGITHAFSIKKRVRSVDDKSNRLNDWKFSNPTTWGNIFEEPEYGKKEIQDYIITTNPKFNWDSDSHTQATYDVLNAGISFPVKIVPASSQITRYAGKIGLDPNGKKGGARGWSWEDGSRLTWLSDNLSSVNPETPLLRVWTFGGTALHELTIHHHPIGDIEGSGRLDARYNLPTGRMGAHKGAVKKKTTLWNQKLLNRLHNERMNTGSQEEIKNKKDNEGNDKRDKPSWINE